MRVAGVERGCQNAAVHLEWPALTPLLLSCDPLLVAAELVGLAAVLVGAARLLGQLGLTQAFYDDLVAVCVRRNVSATEVFGVLALTLGFVVFDGVLALAEDDVFDNVGSLLLVCFGVAMSLTILGVDVQFFYMNNSASNGEISLRVVYNDILHNGLCFTRILFCWIRYLFYDLQAELVDMTFHFAEVDADTAVANLALLGEASPAAAQGLLLGTAALLVGQLLAVVVDVAA